LPGSSAMARRCFAFNAWSARVASLASVMTGPSAAAPCAYGAGRWPPSQTGAPAFHRLGAPPSTLSVRPRAPGLAAPRGERRRRRLPRSGRQSARFSARRSHRVRPLRVLGPGGPSRTRCAGRSRTAAGRYGAGRYAAASAGDRVRSGRFREGGCAVARPGSARDARRCVDAVPAAYDACARRACARDGCARGARRPWDAAVLRGGPRAASAPPGRGWWRRERCERVPGPPAAGTVCVRPPRPGAGRTAGRRRGRRHNLR
jgi:hypothetical protein